MESSIQGFWSLSFRGQNKLWWLKSLILPDYHFCLGIQAVAREQVLCLMHVLAYKFGLYLRNLAGMRSCSCSVTHRSLIRCLNVIVCVVRILLTQDSFWNDFLKLISLLWHLWVPLYTYGFMPFWCVRSLSDFIFALHNCQLLRCNFSLPSSQLFL